MKIVFLLMAQYDGQAVVPIDAVACDYFSYLTTDKLIRKVSTGEIAIPMVRIEDSQKCAKGAHLSDLAAYIDKRVEAARMECRPLTGA